MIPLGTLLGHIPTLLAVATIALCGVQTVRLANVKAEFAEYKAATAKAALAAETAARQRERDLQAEVERISAHAQQRTQTLITRAAAADRALAGLRHDLAAANAGDLSADPAAAPFDHDARVARELLGACATAYRDVAEDADRLKNQLITAQEYAAGVSRP